MEGWGRVSTVNVTTVQTVAHAHQECFGDPGAAPSVRSQVVESLVSSIFIEQVCTALQHALMNMQFSAAGFS